MPFGLLTRSLTGDIAIRWSCKGACPMQQRRGKGVSADPAGADTEGDRYHEHGQSAGYDRLSAGKDHIHDGE